MSTDLAKKLALNNRLFVEQLDRDDNVLKSYIFRSAYPQTMGEIALSYDTNNEIETFDLYGER